MDRLLQFLKPSETCIVVASNSQILIIIILNRVIYLNKLSKELIRYIIYILVVQLILNINKKSTKMYSVAIAKQNKTLQFRRE
jgi:hypothetical protein